jgi:hypothetical protein
MARHAAPHRYSNLLFGFRRPCNLKSSCLLVTFACVAVWLAVDGAVAQQSGLQPGEGFLTRFSGVTRAPRAGGQPVPVINVNGISGSIVDLRAPGFPPMGIHWMTEPQTNPVTAGQVGQVFGVVLDDANPPNIYLSATSAFGLHLAPGTTQWMPGMWGQGGGPGTIYRLDAANNYRPSVFATIALNNRQNTGAALGNIAYDRINHQIFVSDLETGMIHRVRATDGTLLDVYDHGTQGRQRFADAPSNQQLSLPPIPFNPASSARISNCPTGSFANSPECWNFAASGRRVWGLAVRRDPASGDERLYYAVMSSPAFGNGGWSALPEDEKRNSIWSVHIAAGGAFDPSDVRREFQLPDFFAQPQDVARAGYSSPISDIAFADCGPAPVMLIAERGTVRNLGLGADGAFAYPHEARALRYQLGQSGTWQPVGRYDIGFYDRRSDSPPYVHANCAGGIAFGYGYSSDYASVDQTQPEQYVWLTADSLCSPSAPCFLPQSQQQQAAAQQPQLPGDPSEVHGLAGLPAIATDPLMPPSALRQYPASGPPYPSVGPQVSYLIDADIDVDPSGKPIEPEFVRNDATRIGDVAVYEICPTAPPPTPVALAPVPPPVAIAPPPPPEIYPSVPVPIYPVPVPVVPVIPIHLPIGSIVHLPPGSVIIPPGGGNPPPPGGHDVIASIVVNHTPSLSNIHVPVGSTGNHTVIQSIVVNHLPSLSNIHVPVGSTGTHSLAQSVVVNHPPALSSLHLPAGSTGTHSLAQSVVVNHPPALSNLHLPAGSTGTHSLAQSVVVNHPPALSNLHLPAGSTGTHSLAQSVVVNHSPALSNLHLPAGSTGTHSLAQSVVVNHTAAVSAVVTHNAAQSAVGPHSPATSAVVHDASQSLITNHTVALSSVHVPAGSTVTHQTAQSVVVNHSPAISTVHVPAGSTTTHALAQSALVVHAPAASANVHDATQSALSTHTAAASSIHVPAGSSNAHSIAQSGVVIHPQHVIPTGPGSGGLGSTHSQNLQNLQNMQHMQMQNMQMQHMQMQNMQMHK